MLQLGTHLVVELVGCRFDQLDDMEFIQRSMLDAAHHAKATVLDNSFHKFAPQGVSGVVVLAESHLSVHTWPEDAYAAVDIFTCGDDAMPHKAVEHLVQVLKPRASHVREIPRGIPAETRGADRSSDTWSMTPQERA